jgi:hypothetical protein
MDTRPAGTAAPAVQHPGRTRSFPARRDPVRPLTGLEAAREPGTGTSLR